MSLDSNYSIKEINELCEINSSNYSKKDNWNFINYLDTKNIIKGEINEIQLFDPNYDKVPSRAKRKVKIDDIIISTVRPNQEHYGIIKNKIDNFLVSTGFTTLTVDKTQAKPEFIYYYITQKYITESLQTIAEQSTTSYPSIKPSDIGNLLIELPPLEIQEKISQILTSIENKISVNKEINNHLEEVMLKIFNSWFVKFELSNELIDSKLGLIPKGWKVDYLGSKKSCSIIGSGIENFDDFKIYIATADVDNSIITNYETLITMEDKPSRANMQPVPKSIWFAKMIDSRKLIMVDDYSEELLNNYIFSTGFCGLKCVDKYFYYLWTFLLTDAFDNIKNNFCTGTTMQAINNKDTKLIEFVIPNDELLFRFNSIAEPIYKEIYYNNIEIRKLQKLRDTLLPMLMSGEIDITKVNYDLKKIIRKFILSFLNYLWRQLYENKNYFKNTKSNETLLEPRPIHKINKLFTKFIRRYRYNRQQY